MKTSLDGNDWWEIHTIYYILYIANIIVGEFYKLVAPESPLRETPGNHRQSHQFKSKDRKRTLFHCNLVLYVCVCVPF